MTDEQKERTDRHAYSPTSEKLTYEQAEEELRSLGVFITSARINKTLVLQFDRCLAFEGLLNKHQWPEFFDMVLGVPQINRYFVHRWKALNNEQRHKIRTDYLTQRLKS